MGIGIFIEHLFDLMLGWVFLNGPEALPRAAEDPSQATAMDTTFGEWSQMEKAHALWRLRAPAPRAPRRRVGRCRATGLSRALIRRARTFPWSAAKRGE